MSTNPPAPPLFSSSNIHDEITPPSSISHTPKYEVRLYGLNPAVTTDNLVKFFSAKSRVLGVLLHPQEEINHGLQWAQVWVWSEEEVQKCLELRAHLAPSGITLSRAPSALFPSSQGLLKADSGAQESSIGLRAPSTPSLTRGIRPDLSGLGYRHIDPQGPLPRNLYVMGLPLDLTQNQYKTLFSQYGMVEHSTLLSQLDGMGRRRGFILMSTHREAVDAMQAMNGNWVEERGKISGLDAKYFPSAGAIRDVFAHFGPVARVTVTSTSPFQILIQFEHEVSAVALLNADGLNLGGRPIITRRHPTSTAASSSPPSGRPTFDPFGQDFANRLSNSLKSPSGANHLSADSDPFIPLNWKTDNGVNKQGHDQATTNEDPQSNSGYTSRTNSESTKTSVEADSSTAYDTIGTDLTKQGQDRWRTALTWCEPSCH
ncbi:hypothetical protein IAR55_005168 [Kwoniella newhampshirensis]|uniref:RRM domain-containing protein n=1 Tax=Kwoniella newhampshirensis TaxID=1651941 RepID=A0AAW0YXA7_9TREE